MCLKNRFVKLPSPEEKISLGIIFTQRILPKNVCHARRHFFKFAEFRCLEMGYFRPSGSSLGSGEDWHHFFKFAEFRCLETGICAPKDPP